MTSPRTPLSEVAARPPRVLVIGGGINGIGLFRELALNGVDALLVERADYSSGASAASSHMIHGGIRYLENGELRLVKESVVERNRLLRIAPHYVAPLPTTIPIFSTFSGLLSAPFRLLLHRNPGRPKERGALLIKVGLIIYDTFSRDGGTVPRHRFHGRRKSLTQLPELNPNLKYTATYYDASLRDPERLALDVLLDGLAAGDHARARNYTEVVGASDGGVRLRDALTGDEATVHPELVVNVTGPAVDLTNAALGLPTDYMGGTKGSHIVLEHPELLEATGGREIFFENDDGRIVLIYPLKGRVLVGTTDLEADARETPECTPAEIDYFFELVRHVYPGIEVTRDHIVYTYSGIRPLPHHDDLAPGFVSRDYRIVTDDASALDAPVVSLVGGKWTTFRAVAESLGDHVLDSIAATRSVGTETLPIGGGRDYPSGEAARAAWPREHLPGVDPTRAEELFERYGTRAIDVLPYLGAGDIPVLGGRLSTGELRYLVEHEHVQRLSDVALRRTTLAFRGQLDAAGAAELAAALAPLLDWDAARAAREEATVVDRLREGRPWAPSPDPGRRHR